MERKNREVEFGSRLLDAMHKKGINRVMLAEATGISRQSIGYYCNGTNVPDIINAKKIADALDVSLDWLADRDCKCEHVRTAADLIDIIEREQRRGNIGITADSRGVIITIHIPEIEEYFNTMFALNRVLQEIPQKNAEALRSAVEARREELIKKAKTISLQ